MVMNFLNYLKFFVITLLIVGFYFFPFKLLNRFGRESRMFNIIGKILLKIYKFSMFVLLFGIFISISEDNIYLLMYCLVGLVGALFYIGLEIKSVEDLEKLRLEKDEIFAKVNYQVEELNKLSDGSIYKTQINAKIKGDKNRSYINIIECSPKKNIWKLGYYDNNSNIYVPGLDGDLERKKLDIKR